MSLLKQQRAVVARAKWRYDVGLEKIADAKSQVSALQIELNDLEPILEKAARETAAIMETCTTEKAKASEKQELVAEDQAKAEVQKANAATIKADCENDLAAAMPAFEAAMDALSKLSKADITEVKGMKVATPGVLLTAQGMCIMFE